MTKRLRALRMLLFAWLGVLLLSFAPAVALGRDGATESPLDRLRAAVEKHPTDPDLRFALARKLARAGDAAGALENARTYLAKWPDRRADARVELAAAMLDGAAAPEAMVLLDEAIAAAPRAAMPRFYRGIAFRSTGRIEAANREFKLAGQLEPALRAETLLARALGLFDLGREDKALTLLREIVTQDPTSDTAVRARLLLRQRELPGQGRRFRVDAYGGIEYDDNVTLENSENTIAASGRNDFRWVWGLGGSVRALQTNRARITVGYRYDQTSHIHLGNFDVLGNTVYASGAFALTDDLILRLDGAFGNTLQDDHNELIGGSIRPGLIYSLGPKAGAVRAFAQVEFSEYDNVPVVAAFERDAITTSVGLEYFVPLPLDASWLALSGAWSNSRTQADTNGTAEGFDGDFDYDAWRVRLATTLELPLEIRFQLDGSYTRDRYHNKNLAYRIATGTGTRARRDDIMSGRVALSREIVDPVRIELYWRGTRRVSNIAVFDYDKQVVGALIRVAID